MIQLGVRETVPETEQQRLGREHRLENIYLLSEQLRLMRKNEKLLELQIKNEIELAHVENTTIQGQYKITQKTSTKTTIDKDLLFATCPEKFLEIAKIEITPAKALLTEEEFATVATTSTSSKDVVVKTGEEPHEE